MKTLHNNYCNSKQGYLPLFLSDCLDLLDPVLTFDRLMGGIDLNKYLTDIPSYRTFVYFINEILQDKIENIFKDINMLSLMRSM